MSDAIQREKEIEKNKREAIEIAAKIFKIVKNPAFVNQLDADQRHAICVEKNKGFAQAFPLVLSKMSRDLAYSEKAFQRFLDKLHKDPGKGMEGIIERQADYAAYLYEELCKEQGKHYNMKTRRDIWQLEYQQMYKWMRDIKKQEKQAKNELEEESKKALEERKNELLEFLNANDSSTEPKQSIEDIIRSDEAYIDMLRTTSEHETPDMPAPLTSDLDFPEYTGYAEVQKSTLIPSDVLQTRQPKDDWLSDSNVPSWKKKTTKTR
jgi:hypothetical protein